MTSAFFYRLKVKTTPRKGVSKLGAKKSVFDFLCENGLERTTKTIPVGNFADITFFHPFSGVESWGEFFLFDFFRENGSQGTMKTISEGIFAVITFFTPFWGLEFGGEIFYSTFFVKMVKKSLHGRFLKNFLLSKYFSALSGGRILGVNFFYSIFPRKNSKVRSAKTIPEGVLAVQTYLTPLFER